MKQKERYIPQNVIKNNRFLGFKKRNLIEGIIAAILMALLINAIPFVFKVKLIIIIVLGIAIILLNSIGIKGNAISITVYNYLTYRYYTNKFTYRRLGRDTKQLKPLINDKKEVRTIKENKSIKVVKNLIG